MEIPSKKRKYFYLKRINSPDDGNYRLIPLKNDKIVIGRSSNSYSIKDAIISRSHAEIKRLKGESFTIKNLSTSGTLLNSTPLSVGVEVPLPLESVVQFCSAVKKYVFRFNCKEIPNEKSTDLPRCSIGSVSFDKSPCANISHEVNDRIPSLESSSSQNQLEIIKLTSQLDENKDKYIKLLSDKELELKAMMEQKESLQEKHIDERSKLESQIAIERQKQRELADNEELLAKELQQKIAALNQKLEEETKSVEKVLQQSEENKQKLEDEKNRIRIEMEKENSRLQTCLVTEKRLLQEQMESMKMELQEKLNSVQNELDSERVKFAAKVENEKEEQKRLQELEKMKSDLEESLRINQEKQDKVIPELEGKLQKMEEERNLLQQEMVEIEFAASAEARRHVVDKVSEAMDTEMQCVICNELYIRATLLGCSHTFCEYCINCWKKNKKECPTCRTHIASESRVLAIDNFIATIVGNLSHEMKTNREKLVKEREEAVAAEEVAKRAAEAERQARTASRRGGRSRSRQPRNQTRAQPAALAQPQNAVPLTGVMPIAQNVLNVPPIRILMSSNNGPVVTAAQNTNDVTVIRTSTGGNLTLRIPNIGVQAQAMFGNNRRGNLVMRTEVRGPQTPQEELNRLLQDLHRINGNSMLL